MRREKVVDAFCEISKKIEEIGLTAEETVYVLGIMDASAKALYERNEDEENQR